MQPLSLYRNLALERIYAHAKPKKRENINEIIVTCRLFNTATEKLFFSKRLIKCLNVNDFGIRERDEINSLSTLTDKENIQYTGKRVQPSKTRIQTILIIILRLLCFI